MRSGTVDSTSDLVDLLKFNTGLDAIRSSSHPGASSFFQWILTITKSTVVHLGLHGGVHQKASNVLRLGKFNVDNIKKVNLSAIQSTKSIHSRILVR